jgi:serine/threonine-protein kinase
MEHLVGETLEARLAKGSLPLERTLEYAIQIADALEAAHKQNIVHRDLKPSNIMLTPEGHVKVMDFGLAKRVTPVEGQEQEITTALTQQGSTLGTVPYMSPEQVRGQEVDTRSDIFSFGVVVYEMLSGLNPFKKGSAMDTATAILSETPPPLTRYTDDIPVLLQHTVKKMLAKKPDRRYQLIHEVRTDLGDLIEESGDSIREVVAGPSGTVSAAGWWRRTIPWSIALGIAIIAGVFFWILTRPTQLPLRKFVITPPATTPLLNSADDNELAVSPDGRHIVYWAYPAGGVRQLYVRSLDEFMARSIPGTEGAEGDQFFSPNGQSVAFFTAAGELKKVLLTGGAPITICEAPSGKRSGSWGEDTIVFSSQGPLYRVSATGGEPEILATPDPEKGEVSYLLPEMLPGGQALLFTIWTSTASQIALLSLETGEQKVLFAGRQAHYAPTGHLVYALSETGTLMAAPFDLATLEVTGDAVPILEEVRQGSSDAVDYALSDEGTLVYVPDQTAEVQRLVWVDREGTESVITQEDVSFGTPRISPDGKQVAVAISREGETQNIWIYDLESKSLRRLTFGGGGVENWSPDGKWIIFQGRDSAGLRAISRQLADGSGPIEHLTVSTPDAQMPQSLTPDGRVVAFGKNNDLWTLQIEGDREPQPFITSPNVEGFPKFSPDGKWIAYVSNELGPMNVYVSPYPKPDVKYLVSEEEGGGQPVWSPDGTELFYRSGSRMMVVSVETEPAFRPGKPEVLFEGRYVNSRFGPENPYYDISSDGQQFLMIKDIEGRTGQINVVLNWFEELKRLVPTDN